MIVQHTSLGPVDPVFGHLDGLAGRVVDDFARFPAGVLVHDCVHPGRLARALVDELELNLGAERRTSFSACTAFGVGSVASN